MINNIKELSHLTEEDILNKFNGHYVALYREDSFYCKGIMLLDLFSYAQEKYKGLSDGLIKMSIKDFDAEGMAGIYVIRSILKIEKEYVEITITSTEFEILENQLISEIKTSDTAIKIVPETAYSEFLNEKNQIDWKKIRLSPELSGKDTSSEADAFEAMCQEIVEKWGAKDFERIGKGADRGRDGTFKISADSWIPIITDYANTWILQCKYSREYSNLQIDEVYKEVVKVIMHKPDYYLIMTNRKITSDFLDWFKQSLQNSNNYIPFKCILIDRQQIEFILEQPDMIRIKKKYFG